MTPVEQTLSSFETSYNSILFVFNSSSNLTASDKIALEEIDEAINKLLELIIMFDPDHDRIANELEYISSFPVQYIPTLASYYNNKLILLAKILINKWGCVLDLAGLEAFLKEVEILSNVEFAEAVYKVFRFQS